MKRGFTLIETLVVLAIMVTVFGFVGSSFLRTDGRVQAVKAAAEELAATCRQARAMAIARNATHAVVFNIQNHPDSSGRVLNNRSGGHWYRILGPASSVSSMRASRVLMDPFHHDNIPPVVGGVDRNGYWTMVSYPYTLAQASELIEASWAAEAHVLPAGKVRFLALSDMDYGDFTSTGTTRVPSATVSYPRPWFGWWDKDNAAGGGAGRLYPWGGYDQGIPGSGFYYWGLAAASSYARVDPAPVASRNAVTRALDRWVDGQINNGSDGNPDYVDPIAVGADVIYEVDSPRPLINAAWRDVSILFTGSGEVLWGGCMPGRHCWMHRDTVIKTGSTRTYRGVAERCNGIFGSPTDEGWIQQHYQAEMGTFERDSGGFLVTLAPDSADDRDVFSSAKEVMDSVMPMYRVFISVLGDVRVIAVSRTAAMPAGKAPFPTSQSWWRTAADVKRYFGQDRLVTGARTDSTGTGIGEAESGGPITGFLTAEMLQQRAVWLK